MNGSDAERAAAAELRRYLWTFSLCLLLTVPVFALVAWEDLDKSTLGWIIGASALIQIAVHFRGFLNIRLKGQTREDLHLILFTALLLVLMAGGTIWILTDLEHRMHGTKAQSMPEGL